MPVSTKCATFSSVYHNIYVKNEAQTRREIIDKRLKQAGWDVNDPSMVSEELDIWVGLPDGVSEPVTEYQGHNFADYALLGKDGYPLAVVEAKRTSKDARIGQEQARQYAEKIQNNSHGKDIPFVYYTNGYEIYFWDSERYPPRKVYGFPTREDLERIRHLRNYSKPLSEELINKNISGRPYQIKAIRSVLEGVEKEHRKFLLVMATGTGKTRTCIALIDVLMRAGWAQRVLFLVDRIALRDQALGDFKEYLPNSPVFPKEGETEIQTDRRLYVVTYPTMLNVIQSPDCKLTPHFFDLIVIDESHRSIYNTYKNILDYFDAIQLGLTATPKDVIDFNTFQLFQCDDGLPTFAYSYEEAINDNPPYLCDFEVLRIRTKFQKEGINRESIGLEDQLHLLREGKDVDEINYEGTELEKRVTNKGTNALIVREFIEECIKDDNGVLPGKSIFFAITKAHARRLQEIFDQLYPEFKGRLATVIVSEDPRVHGKGGLLDQFKNNDFPRIAISVDMLDTGIDIRELVNLVFAKPIFSFTKFWQMIGRGTRLLEPKKIKPWCTKKGKFLIIDCWENFEYFKLTPKGKELKNSKPLPVRLFESRIEKLKVCIEKDNQDIRGKTIQQLRNDLKQLPKNSVPVLDKQRELSVVEDDNFWLTLNEIKIDFLSKEIAPVLKAVSGVDFKAMRFEVDIVDTSTAKLLNYQEQYETLSQTIIEQISELPLSVNIVAKERELVEQSQTQSYWAKATDDDFDVLVLKLGPLMIFRQVENPFSEIDKMNLKDLVVDKEYIEFGPQHERITVNKYRELIEKYIHELEQSNPVIQKLKSGAELTASEINEISLLLQSKEPYITEDLLKKIYDNKHAKFIQFIKHILGLEKLENYTETVTHLFNSFIAEHNTFTEKQIQFLLTLKTYILQTGKVEKIDLVNAPFTQLHPQGIRGIFNQKEIDEILKLTEILVA